MTAGKPAVAYAHVATQSDAPGRWPCSTGSSTPSTTGTTCTRATGRWSRSTSTRRAPRTPSTRKPTSIGYSQHEGAERASLGRQQARARGRHASGAVPGQRLACRLLQLGAVPRRLRLAGRRLRRHAGADVSDVRPEVADDSERSRTPPARRSRGSRSRAAGASCSRPSTTARPAPTSRRNGRSRCCWESGWRDRSVAVPAGGALGTRTTEFFCGAIAHGSNLLTRALDNPSAVLLALAVLIGLVAIAAGRTTWRPSAPLRLARRRATGQIISASARMYFGHLAAVHRHRQHPVADHAAGRAPAGLPPARVGRRRDRGSGRGRGRARTARRGARDGADAARRRVRHGGDRARARRARRRAPGEPAARLPRSRSTASGPCSPGSWWPP